MKKRKNRTTAALLALFGGAFGIHKFYLERPGQGVFFILAFIFFYRMSIILGVIDAVRLFMMSDEEFDRQYNSGTREWETFRRARNNRRNRSSSRSTGTTRRESRRSREPSVRRTSRSREDRERRRSATTRSKAPTRRSRPKDNPFKQSGIRRFKEYDISGSIEDFTKALKIEPQDAALHFNIAAAYSINEEKEKAYHHLNQAVSLGMNDTDKIKTHEAFAYLRIQDDWDNFVNNGFKTTKSIAPPAADNLLEDDVLLSQLNKLKELRDKGLLTESEYALQKERLRS